MYMRGARLLCKCERLSARLCRQPHIPHKYRFTNEISVRSAVHEPRWANWFAASQVTCSVRLDKLKEHVPCLPVFGLVVAIANYVCASSTWPCSVFSHLWLILSSWERAYVYDWNVGKGSAGSNRILILENIDQPGHKRMIPARSICPK
jgi:hypothetical protein